MVGFQINGLISYKEMINMLNFNSEKLICTKNITDDTFISEGRISFCIKGIHTFILVESGSYQGDSWEPNATNVKLAFSYVPNSTIKYLENFYGSCLDNHTFIKDNRFSISKYLGYIFFLFSKSHVVDTWKLTDKFIRIKTKPIKNWSFQRQSQFKTYNVLSIIPFFGISDCIGYSCHHYKIT